MDCKKRDLELWTVCRMHRKLAISKMYEEGLNPGQPPILEALWQSDGCTQSGLSKRCHLEPATITSTLSTMERDGLVERRSDPADRRVWRIFLTERGREAHDAVCRVHSSVSGICFEGFSEEETEQMLGYIERMIGNMRDRVE